MEDSLEKLIQQFNKHVQAGILYYPSDFGSEETATEHFKQLFEYRYSQEQLCFDFEEN